MSGYCNTNENVRRRGIVPDYLLTPAYGEGIFEYRSSNIDETGKNIKLWNPAVYERMAALIRALGNRFNSHDYFEGIGLTETALGQPVVVPVIPRS